MFRNAFISEFSFSSDESIDSVLKSHLLSNEKIVIPAATVSKTALGEILNSNVESLGKGAISIAHGSDRDSLEGYIKKYPSEEWKPHVVELFSHFDKNNLCSIYDTKNTIFQFNQLMHKCADGKIKQFKVIFSNKYLCAEIKKHDQLFDLNKYFSIIDNHISDIHEKEILKAHARYYYNYFGSFSTKSGNTFSLENTTGFNHISNGSGGVEGNLTGLNILISSALDLTNGIEDFNFLSNLDKGFINKLSYKDILEIRQNWLHDKIIEKYEGIVQECASSYLKINQGQINDALVHIERAFEIRESILEKVNLAVKSEINAYKFHRFSRFLTDTAISSLSYLSGFDMMKSIVQGITSATTEIAVLTNKEKQLKELVNSKLIKAKKARQKADTAIGGKSPVAEYLRLIEKRLNS